MPRKTTPSREDVYNVIDTIYEAATDGSLWSFALERLADLVGGMFAIVAFQDNTGNFPSYHLSGDSAREIMEPYTEYYRHVDPVLLAARSAPPLKIVTDRMVMSKSEVIRSEVYNDFARPRGIDTVAHGFAARTSDQAYFVAVGRSAQVGEFDTDHVRILNLVLPHLGRAMHVYQRLERTSIRLQSATAVLDRLAYGIVFADSNAGVILANRIGDDLLSEGDGIGTDASGLCAATPAQTASLRRLVAKASDRKFLGGGTMRLDRASSRLPLSVFVAPVTVPLSETYCAGLTRSRVTAILFVLDPEKTPRLATPRLREIFNLTAAEAGVAAHIARGQGVREAAVAIGIAPSTVRWHLQRVFEKTGTMRQAELAGLVERLGIFVSGV